MKKRKGTTPVELLVMAAMATALVFVACKSETDGGKGDRAPARALGDIQVAKENMQKLHRSFLEFHSKTGKFPCDSTAPKFAGSVEGAMTGEDSNCYFRQLIAAGVTDNDAVFLACKPDPAGKAGNTSMRLAPGQNDFSYVMRKPSRMASRRDTGKQHVTESCAPLLLCRTAPGSGACSGEAVTFDARFFHGEALMLSVDGRVDDLGRKPGLQGTGDGLCQPAKSLFQIRQYDQADDDKAAKYIILPPAEK